jgi:hypothetical protein
MSTASDCVIQKSHCVKSNIMLMYRSKKKTNMLAETPNQATNPAVVDPSLLAEQARLGIADPIIRALAADPDSITGPERDRALSEAKRTAAASGNIIVTDDKGVPRWGKEYSEVFTFDGQIRGNYEHVPDDPAEWSPAMGVTAMAGEAALRGGQSHVIFDLDDGSKILIRRTNQVKSAADQKFDLLSSRSEQGRVGQQVQRRELDTNMLKGIVAVPGEQLVLGVDPNTGKHVRTRQKIVSITAFGMTDDRIVDPRHPKLKKPEFHRDTIKAFDETMHDSRRAAVAPEVGLVVVDKVISDAKESHESRPEVAGEDASSAFFEAQVQQSVRDLHERARTENRELTPEEVQEIRKLSRDVQRRRREKTHETDEAAPTQDEKNPMDDELAKYLRDSSIDVRDARQRYEAQVRQFVRGLHQRASGEGRKLNEEEVQQVRLALESVEHLQLDTKRLVA